MAKQLADKYTGDLWGNRRGRAAKPDALTGAQRARRFREKRRLIPVTRNEYCEWCGADRAGQCGACSQGG